MHVVQVLYINVQSYWYVFHDSICHPPLFFPSLQFFHKRDLLYCSFFQILFPGSFISTSHPVVSALLRSLMSGTLGDDPFLIQKAGCAGHGILIELWTLGKESRGIEGREGNGDCTHRKPKMIIGRRGGEVDSSRISACWGI